MVRRRTLSAVLVLALASASQAGVHLTPGAVGVYAETSDSTNAGLSLARLNVQPFTSARFDASGVQTLQPSSAHPSYTSVEVQEMNNYGFVVGTIAPSFQTSGGQPSFWAVGVSAASELSRVNGAIQYNTGSSDGTQTIRVNNQGTIVGSMIRRNTGGTVIGEVLVRWDSSTAAPVELQGLPLSTGTTLGRTYVTTVHDNGTIIGYGMESFSGSLAAGACVALRWSPGGTVPQRLDDLTSAPPGKRYTRAGNANAYGVTVGFTDVYNGNTSLGTRGVVWDAVTTAATELPSPVTPSTATQYVRAYTINDAGSINGTFNQGSDRFPLRWDGPTHQVSQLQTLGTKLNGTTDTLVGRMNALSHCVGFSDFALNGVNVRHATFWAAGGTAVVDLNSLLGAESANWMLKTANTITDTGWIGGGAWYDPDGAGPQSGGNRAYSLLVPQAGTYGRGDANFDTHVNFDDLLILAQHYGKSNPTQDVHVGDLDLNGSVDFDDLLALAQHYESGAAIDPSALGSTFTADWALARAMVPEPASVVCGAMVGLVARRRRTE